MLTIAGGVILGLIALSFLGQLCAGLSGGSYTPPVKRGPDPLMPGYERKYCYDCLKDYDRPTGSQNECWGCRGRFNI